MCIRDSGALALVVPWAIALGVWCAGADAVLLGTCLQAFALLHGGMVISVMSTLNFAQATSMALLLTLALYPMVPPWGVRAEALQHRGALGKLRYLAHLALLVAVTPAAFVRLVALATSWAPHSPTLQYVAAQLPVAVDLAAWDYHVLRTSALPFLFVGYLPVVLEGAAACCLYLLAV